MTTRFARGPRRLDDQPPGFALLSVLLAVGVMAGFVATFGRHVVVEGRGGLSSPALQETRETCHSGLQYARQLLVAGEDSMSGDVPSATCSASYQVIDLPGNRQGLRVSAAGADGLGASRLAEVELLPTSSSSIDGPASLPALGAQTVADVLADASLPVTTYTVSQRLQGVTLSGLLVLGAGVELELDDVVLQGAIVSGAVMDQSVQSVFESALAPRVIVDGNVRIDPHPALPGLAILLPDGVVGSAASDARVQIHGDVVAHDLVLTQSGVLGGNVAAYSMTISDQVDRLGAGRQAPAWSDALQLGGTHEPVFLAIVPPLASLDALAPIIDYWDSEG